MNSTGHCKYDLSADNYSKSATPLQLVLLSVSELSLQIQFLRWRIYFIFSLILLSLKKQFMKVVCASGITESMNQSFSPSETCVIYKLKTVEEFYYSFHLIDTSLSQTLRLLIFILLLIKI